MQCVLKLFKYKCGYKCKFKNIFYGQQINESINNDTSKLVNTHKK